MNRAIYKWLFNKIRRKCPVILLLTLCSILASVSGVLFALGTKHIIDVAVTGDKAAFPNACYLLIGIILCILIFNALLQHMKERIHASLDNEWKKKLLHDLLVSEYRCVSEFHSSELVNRLNNDVRILDDAIVSILPNLFSMVTRLLAAFAILTTLTPWFSLILLVAGLVVILLTGILRRFLKNLHKRVSEADGRVSAMLQETLEKLLAVQAMGIASEIESRTQQRLDERFRLHTKRKNLSLLVNSFVSILYYGAGFAALVFCSVGLLNGTMTFGAMTAVIQLVNQLQGPIVGLSGILPQYTAAIAAAERLYEVDSLPKSPVMDKKPAQSIYDGLDCIKCKEMSFRYDRDLVFECAEFSIPKGSFCLIKGQSGVGKSTLLKLLLGIYTPNAGGIYLQCGNNRIPISGSTRHLFAYVPQGNLIFSGSIKDNLLVVNPDATEEAIKTAVYVSAMDQYLPQLSNGLDTLVGENGAGLSEGQIQRLAIARAVLMDAPIFLLDECTSALDASTEKLVLNRLKELKGKTCIAITHRTLMQDICDATMEISEKKVIYNDLACNGGSMYGK